MRDKCFIWYNSLWLEWTNNVINAILGLYRKKDVRNLLVLAGICSKIFAWRRRSLMNLVLPAADSASRMLHTAHCAGRTAQSAEHAATRACLVQRVMSYSSRCLRIYFHRPSLYGLQGLRLCCREARMPRWTCIFKHRQVIK